MQPSFPLSSSSTSTVGANDAGSTTSHRNIKNGQNSSFSSLTTPSSAVESYSADISNTDSTSMGNNTSNDSSSYGRGGETIPSLRTNDVRQESISVTTASPKKTRDISTPSSITTGKKAQQVSSAFKDALSKLDRIWNVGSSSNASSGNLSNSETTCSSTDDDRVRKTIALLVDVFSKELYNPTSQVLIENEELRSRNTELLNKLEKTRNEVRQMQRSEEKSKLSIKNLLKAVDECTEGAKDSSQSKLVEAKLRSELLQARRERDSSSQLANIAQHSLDLLTVEADALKVEKNRLKHENLRLEREAMSARSIVDSFSKPGENGNSGVISSSSVDNGNYYKDKVNELEIRIHGMQARLMEKDQEIMDLQRCRNRNYSQNRLEILRDSKKTRLS